MTIDQLRETLRQLNSILQAADAKRATTAGLTEFIDATAPFGDLTIKSFVALAEAGRTPPTEKAASPRRGKTAKAGADPETVITEVKSLYDRAAEPDVSEEHIRNACGRLGTLSKDGLVRVAEAVGLAGMKSKKKDELVAEITRRLIERKGAAIRRQLVDRPGSGGGNHLPQPPLSGSPREQTQVSGFPPAPV